MCASSNTDNYISIATSLGSYATASLALGGVALGVWGIGKLIYANQFKNTDIVQYERIRLRAKKLLRNGVVAFVIGSIGYVAIFTVTTALCAP